jgi:hypothetical protein
MRARPQLSYANVVATIALFVSLGGGAYAAGLGKDSVKSKQIAKNAVGASEIRRGAVGKSEVKVGAVDSARIANGTLQAEDFATGQLLRGSEGPQGPQGLTGPTGPSNPNADTLDGFDSSAFTQGGGTTSFDRADLARGASRTLLDMNGIAKVTVSCAAGTGTAHTVFDFDDSAIFSGVYQPDESADAFDWDAGPGETFDASTGDNTYLHLMGGAGSAPGPRRMFMAVVTQDWSPAAATPCHFQTYAIAQTR